MLPEENWNIAVAWIHKLKSSWYESKKNKQNKTKNALKL